MTWLYGISIFALKIIIAYNITIKNKSFYVLSVF